MNGLIALVGAGEYLPVMEDVDRYLLDSVKVDGRAPHVVCLPTAAGQEGDESVDAGREWAWNISTNWVRKWRRLTSLTGPRQMIRDMNRFSNPLT